MSWGSILSDRESFTVDADRERADLWRSGSGGAAHLRFLLAGGHRRCSPPRAGEDGPRHAAPLGSGPLPGPVDGHLPESLRRGRCRGPGLRLAAFRHLPGDRSRGGRSREWRVHPRPPPDRADHRHPFAAEELHGAGGRAGGPGDRLAGDGPGKGARGRPDQGKAQALIRLYKSSPARKQARSRAVPLRGPPSLSFPREGRAMNRKSVKAWCDETEPPTTWKG